MVVRFSKRDQNIWKTVQRIPRGRVASYGQIARLSGLNGRARLVGYVLHHLPFFLDTPWHRVVTAQGRIAFSKHSQAYHRQMALLRKEGVIVDGGKINMKKFGWKR
ncbi:MAG TPA: MGMT family protein [Bacteroidota bacterium]|nr:MGMT family protein [Bacteroidota bacterium]